MDYAELYDATLGILRAMTRRLMAGELDEGQYRQDLSAGGIANRVAAVAGNAAGNAQPGVAPAREALGAEDRTNISGILWQLVGLGILVPTRISDLHNSFFAPTAFGKELLREEEAIGPFDPTAFLAGLRGEAPNLEPETFELLSDGIRAYFAHLYRSAAVMSGVASELEILQLIDLTAATMPAGERSGFVTRVDGARNLVGKFAVLYEKLNAIKRTLPPDIRELDVWLNGMFNLIRIYRNEAGHPNGAAASPAEVYANLGLFRTYGKKLSDLKRHLSSVAVP